MNKSRSLPYCSLENAPSFVNNNKRVCSFTAYFTEVTPENMLEQARSRKVEISLHLEDNTIEINEPRINNSGLLQGKMLRRLQIEKPAIGRVRTTATGSRPSSTLANGNTNSTKNIYTIDDFYSGAVIEIYNRVYTIIDCDVATRKFYESSNRQFGQAMQLPGTLYDPSRIVRVTRKSNKKTLLKNKMAAFYEYDRKVLRFYGVWDSREIFFGDNQYVRLHYSLADDSIEVMPVHTRNSGRDKLAKLLKKTTILKKDESYDNSLSRASTGLGGDVLESTTSMVSTADITAALQPSRPYHWTDLSIGMNIGVAALDIKLIDADEFTREFFISKNMPLSEPIKMPKPKYPTLDTTIPPHNGFGSEADSLQTCKSSLQPSAPSKDGAKAQLYQGMILRFAATFDQPKSEDITRTFIIQVHLEDDTIQIREPPVRNSGHKGGIFLARSNLERHDDSDQIKPQDIYLGATIPILSHKFVILDADEFTLRFMEENNKLWIYSNLRDVVQKLKRNEEIVNRLILTTSGLATKLCKLHEVEGLLKKGGFDINQQEIMTIFRVLDPRRTGSIKLTTLLKYLMSN